MPKSKEWPKFRAIVVGMLTKHEDQYIFMDKDDELYNMCITFVAGYHAIEPGSLDKAVTVLSEHLKIKPEEEPVKEPEKKPKA